MKKIFRSLLILLIAFTLISCSNSSDETTVSKSSKVEYSNYASISNTDTDTDSDSTSLKITYTVSYYIYTSDIKTLEGTIKAKVLEYNGSISDTYETNTYSTIEYKVPANKLNDFVDFVDEIEGVSSKEMESEDITSQYNYTAARIQILEASKITYTNLLSSATTVEDTIAIQKQLDSVNTELTSLYRTKAAYDNQVDYSEITITYRVNEEDEEVSFFSEYFNNILGFFTGLGVALLYIIPIGGVLGGIAFGVVSIIKVIKKKKKSKE